MYEKNLIEKGYESIKIYCDKNNLDIEKIKERIKNFYIETPSWGYADSGTRFGVFKQPNSAKTLYDKIDDAAFINKITGVTPTVALHIPWDKVDNWDKLKEYAESQNLKIGAINPNLFQEDIYKHGSLTSSNPEVQKKAIEHIMECIDIMRHTDSKILSLWFADGTNYPGTDNFRERHNRLASALQKVSNEMDSDMKMLIEYKFFEPAFYHTDIADWGIANLLARKVGDKAKVLVDLGHHPLGTNIEFIVSILLNENMLGGFHFNDKKYADDDLTSGSIAPYQLFLIFNEISDFEQEKNKIMPIAYMVDQSHNLKHKLVAMVQTIENIQIAFAQSLLVNRKKLKEAQTEYNIEKAELILKDAFLTDVRPLLAEVRKELGINPDIISECINSDYLKKVSNR